MAKDTSAEFRGERVPAVELDFETEKEPWCIYKLEDGTVLRMKQILAKIMRLRDKHKPDGEPVYVFHASGVVHIDVPPELKKSAQGEQPESKQ